MRLVKVKTRSNLSQEAVLTHRIMNLTRTMSSILILNTNQLW